MLFVHRAKPAWRARIQTVDREREPLVARLLDEVDRRTRVPVVINTSLNTAGRPMVDDPLTIGV